MQYTITAVSPQTRTYTTKFGDMISYRVRFEGVPEPVEISQKVTTPAPQAGQTVDGTIDMSGQYGPKFKKEYNQGGGFTQGPSQPQTGGGNTTQATSASSGRFGSDPFTMYLSYAKDVAVALIGTKEGYDEEKFSKILEDVIKGGEVLYEGRPGAEPKKDNLPDEGFDGNAEVDMSNVDKMFPEAKQEKIDVGDIPF